MSWSRSTVPRSNVSVCLDAWALLAWIQDEAAADRVAKFLAEGKAGGDTAAVSVINLGEVYYAIARNRSEEAADAFWHDAKRGTLPLAVIEATAPRVRAAARLKARFPISYADAFAMSTALEMKAPLATGDPEIRAAAPAAGLKLIWLGKR